MAKMGTDFKQYTISHKGVQWAPRLLRLHLLPQPVQSLGVPSTCTGTLRSGCFKVGAPKGSAPRRCGLGERSTPNARVRTQYLTPARRLVGVCAALCASGTSTSYGLLRAGICSTSRERRCGHAADDREPADVKGDAMGHGKCTNKSATHPHENIRSNTPYTTRN